MIVYFKNETSDTIIIELGENHIEIKSGMKIRVDSETNRIKFNCYLNQYSNFKTMKSIKFVVLSYNFILNVLYDISVKCEEAEIRLTEKEVKGDHAEKYRFLNINDDCLEILNKEFKVKDQEKSKLQLAEYRRRDERASKYLKVFDVLKIICYIGVPCGILFFGAWYFADELTALYVTVLIAIIGLVAGLLLRNLIKKVNKKLDKLGKYQNYLYVDTNSYFQNEYISNVINNYVNR